MQNAETQEWENGRLKAKISPEVRKYDIISTDGLILEAAIATLECAEGVHRIEFLL